MIATTNPTHVDRSVYDTPVEAWEALRRWHDPTVTRIREEEIDARYERDKAELALKRADDKLARAIEQSAWTEKESARIRDNLDRALAEKTS